MPDVPLHDDGAVQGYTTLTLALRQVSEELKKGETLPFEYW